MILAPPPERHFIGRIGWLRPAVLGANDGIVSTASLILAVAAASVERHGVVLTGAAGLAAGAMSMAAGEYVSVSSQADTERAGLAKERAELKQQPWAEERELAAIYVDRGLTPHLARQLMDKDALTAHARDELGILEITTARPVQAAVYSAISFAAGAAAPLMAAVAKPDHRSGVARPAGWIGRGGRLDRRRADVQGGAARHGVGRLSDGGDHGTWPTVRFRMKRNGANVAAARYGIGPLRPSVPQGSSWTVAPI